MAFFENLGKKVGEAAQTAAKKSSELVEVTKLNMSISSEEDKIQKLYGKMGKKIFENYCSGVETRDDFKEDCEAIKNHQQTIENIKQKIREIKNVKICDGCGAEIVTSSAFCSKCGAKFKVEEPPAQQAEETAKEKLCPSCNAKLPDDAAFCTNCGSKIE